ncbi:hypothetical protein CDL60_27200 [Roseateles noduli]|nr:hypothetical protein CDL60_27200 [Roseateles noduli]
MTPTGAGAAATAVAGVVAGAERIGTDDAVRAVTVAGTAAGGTSGGGVGTAPVAANRGFFAAACADSDGRTGPMMSLPPPPFATGVSVARTGV